MKKYGRVMLRPFRASVPHASVMPCLDFEVLIIKQVNNNLSSKLNF
jgi:hypothetical protein